MIENGEQPSVSIVIVNLNGARHLPDCIRSIRRLDYPADKIEIVVVDNGSSDGSAALLEQDFPQVRLLRNERNEGFAKPSNDGARAASGEYVAFLNNDMRVERGWLLALVQSLRSGAADCAGSLILNWDGSAIDFMGGGVGFYGYGFQTHFGEPLRRMESSLREDRELLFACGGAMLIGRELFLACGGFDESYFAYYEDADLGWRLHVMGYKVVLSVRSRVCHRHNGTSGTMPRPRVQYLYERNKLYSSYKNYGDELFYKAFLPSLLLEIRETCLFSPLDAENYDLRNPAAFDEEPARISQMTAIKLNALNEFVRMIPQLQEKRAFVQGRRREEDKNLRAYFTDPFIVFPKDTADFLDARYDIVKAFGIDTLFGRELRCGVAFLLGGDAGQSAPYAAVARCLAACERYEVTVACPQGGAAVPGAKVLSYGDGGVLDAVKRARVVFLCAPLDESCWTRELAQEAQNKFLAADAQILEAAGETPLGRFAAARGDFFLCMQAQSRGAVARALKTAARLPVGREESAYLWSPAESGAEEKTAALVEAARRFCARPVHLPRPQAYLKLEPGLLAERPADDSAEARFAHIERLLLREHRLLQKTEETVWDVKELSELMDRRFRKIKGKLGRFRFLRRFIKG